MLAVLFESIGVVLCVYWPAFRVNIPLVYKVIGPELATVYYVPLNELTTRSLDPEFAFMRTFPFSSAVTIEDAVEF